MEGNTAMAFTGNVSNVVMPSPKKLPTIGGLFRYPLATAIPTSLTTLPTTGKKALGFISEAGIDEMEARPTTKIFAWGGDLVAEPQDNYELHIVFTLFEFLNPDVAKTAYGDNNVTVTASDATHGNRLTILQTSDQFDDYTWCWDAFSPGGKRVQKWFAIGGVKSRDTMSTNNKEILSHRLTVGMRPDANGAYTTTLTDDGVLTP